MSHVNDLSFIVIFFFQIMLGHAHTLSLPQAEHCVLLYSRIVLFIFFVLENMSITLLNNLCVQANRYLCVFMYVFRPLKHTASRSAIAP